MAQKHVICSVGDTLRFFDIGRLVLSRMGFYVRAVNYHATPSVDAENFRRQLVFYQRYFDNASPERLLECLRGGPVGMRPALLLSFDDGYRSNFDVAAPMLEEFGFTGWFFVSAGRIRAGQRGGRTVDGAAADNFMSVNELRALDQRGHVIGCHTHSHVRLSSQLSHSQLEDEIVGARSQLAEMLGHPIDSFCWVGGEEYSYSAVAQRLIEKECFRFSFMTNNRVVTCGTDPLWIQRTNIEADWPLSQVRFYLSGVMDLAYWSKRIRIKRRLKQT